MYVLALVSTLYLFWYAWEIPFQRLRHSNFFLGPSVALYFLYNYRETYLDAESNDLLSQETFARVKRVLGKVLTLFFAVSILVVSAYVELNFERLQNTAPVVGYTQTDYLVGWLLIITVTEATRRAFGTVFASVVGLSVVYGFVGPYLPGLFYHSGFSVQEVSRYSAISLEGAYGFILGVGTTWVAIFIVFAGMIKHLGALDWVLELADEASTTLKTGIVQGAVIASMVMGSITGSAAANTATTGSFTIPMIKQEGISGEYAAAIESVASSGGQMLPPVMGVAAFLMADILGVEYVVIIQAGVLPALLFYFGIALSIYLLSRKYNWETETAGTFDTSILLSGIHFVIPIAVLVYLLVVLRYTPLLAGLYTIIAMVAVFTIKYPIDNGLSLSTVGKYLWMIVESLKKGAVEMAPLTGVLAAMGVIIGMLTSTGFAQQLSTQMLALAGGSFVLLLVIAMVSSILFGLGMPTPAAYLLVVILTAPALVQFGMADLTAHMYVFYFAMLSAITPPVAISVAVGSRIADADFMGSCLRAMQIGTVGFIIPYSFVMNPELIIWEFPGTIVTSVFVALGVYFLVVALIGYSPQDAVELPYRAVYFALGMLALVAPTWYIQIAAAIIAILLHLSQWLRARSTTVSEPTG